MSTETPGPAPRQHQGRAGARARKGSKLKPEEVHTFLQAVVGEDFHAKRVLSLADGVVGVLHAATLGIHAIGRGLAAARNLDPKHAIKQVDRLLSNSGVPMSTLLAAWVRLVVGPREELVVAPDWTDFAADDQTVLAMYLVTSHGRATPLVWKCVRKSQLKGNRVNHEFEIVETLHHLLPEHVSITLLADRGFGDIRFYEYLNDIGWSALPRPHQGRPPDDARRRCDVCRRGRGAHDRPACRPRRLMPPPKSSGRCAYSAFAAGSERTTAGSPPLDLDFGRRETQPPQRGEEPVTLGVAESAPHSFHDPS